MDVIDLNADLGETVDGVPTTDDEALFAVISSANVACGGHAGDTTSMARSVERAALHGVAVGAHPSYPDRPGFGRRHLRISPDELRVELDAQLRSLEAAGADIRYVKAHGALYHAVTTDAAHARALTDAVVALADRRGRAVPLLGMPGVISTVADRAGVPFVLEAFLDRGYRADGTLVPRGGPDALIIDPAEIAERAVTMARERIVRAVNGATIEVAAASLCLHGDSPGSVVTARAVRRALDDGGIEVRAPW